MPPQPDKRYAVDTLDTNRTYAADVDAHRDPSKLAARQSPDATRADRPEADEDDAIAATAGQNGQT